MTISKYTQPVVVNDVKQISPKFIRSNKAHALFKCKCGVKFICSINQILTGRKKSCGCRKNKITHGHATGYTQTKTYRTWRDMLSRCINPNHKHFNSYGGRGISVDIRWKHFSSFLQDMGEPPTTKYSLDRENVNGNYTKENCRWLLLSDQNSNKRNTIYVLFNGRPQCAAKVADKLGVPRSTMYHKIKQGQTTFNNTPP